MRLVLALAIGFGCGVKSEDAERKVAEAIAGTSAETPAVAEPSAPEPAPAAEPVPAPDPELPGFDAALARSIVRVEAKHFRVDSFVATLVAEHLDQTGGAPIFRRVPRKQIKAGAPNGFRVGSIEKGSLFARLGLRNGDVITKVGTAAPPVPKKLKAVLESVERELEVELTRKGETITLRYELADEQAWRDYLEKTTGRKLEEPQVEDEPRHASASGAKSAGGGAVSGGGASSSSAASSSGSGKPTGGASGSSGASTPESIPVSCSSASSCTVAKWYFDKVVSSSSQMRSQAKVAPASGGYKLSWVKPGSGVHKLLFRAGDVITRVNGFDLDNQLEALTLYAGLKSTRTYKVNYVRGGKTLTKTIRVV